MADGLPVGALVEVEVTGFAHGGLGVGRADGQVVFVSGALPGELVLARVTEIGSGGRFVRADTVGVETASPHRVTPPCPYAVPGGCGGCDLQHATVDYQRELKAGVITEQFSRLARIDVDVPVDALPGSADGLGYRTRIEYAVGPDGRAGLRRSRSHEVVEIAECLLGVEGARGEGVLDREWRGVECIDVVVSSSGERRVVPVLPGQRKAPTVTEFVAGQSFTLSARGFWQVHVGAAETFVTTALSMLDPQPGDRVLDLYSGAGLFTAFLADAVTPLGQVIAVESDRDAAAAARANTAAYRNVVVLDGRVDDLFGVPRPKRPGGQRTRPRKTVRSPLLPAQADLVLLDPPRTGAGRGVCSAVAALAPRAIVYVACDPAALARDTAYLMEAGYRLGEIRAFDAFPMTHHVETIALLVRD